MVKRSLIMALLYNLIKYSLADLGHFQLLCYACSSVYPEM